MYDEEIFLIAKSEEESVDEYGDNVFSEKKRSILAEIKSVGMREFYQAQTSGFNPEIIFEIADYLDYDDERQVEYNGRRYKVIRTYRKGTTLEIVCGGGVRDGNA